VPEAIVGGALLGVGEHGVGLGALLEAFLRVRIIGIAVGMMLQGELAVGALDLLLARGADYTQDFVIIAFAVVRQVSRS
jgi:hypothetical protein